MLASFIFLCIASVLFIPSPKRTRRAVAKRTSSDSTPEEQDRMHIKAYGAAMADM